jgi:hypothetical protein
MSPSECAISLTRKQAVVPTAIASFSDGAAVPSLEIKLALAFFLSRLQVTLKVP